MSAEHKIRHRGGKRGYCKGDRAAHNEAVELGSHPWETWRHSLLDYLGIEFFPNLETESKLHNLWNARMKFREGNIDLEELTEKHQEIFGDQEIEEGSILGKSVRYITNRLQRDSVPPWR